MSSCSTSPRWSTSKSRLNDLNRSAGLSAQSFCAMSLRNATESETDPLGPLSEELVFRSTILSVSLLGGLTTKELIFGTPLWFGLAHIHHAIEVWKTGGKTRKAAIQALAGCGEFFSPFFPSGQELKGVCLTFQCFNWDIPLCSVGLRRISF